MEPERFKQIKVFGELSVAMPSDVLASRLGAAKNPLEIAKQVSAIFSEARLQSASVPHLVAHLSFEGVQPSAFLKIANEEADPPFFFCLQLQGPLSLPPLEEGVRMRSKAKVCTDPPLPVLRAKVPQMQTAKKITIACGQFDKNLWSEQLVPNGRF